MTLQRFDLEEAVFVVDVFGGDDSGALCPVEVDDVACVDLHRVAGLAEVVARGGGAQLVAEPHRSEATR